MSLGPRAVVESPQSRRISSSQYASGLSMITPPETRLPITDRDKHQDSILTRIGLAVPSGSVHSMLVLSLGPSS